jgi:serine/threonine-protein kinase RsbW
MSVILIDSDALRRRMLRSYIESASYAVQEYPALDRFLDDYAWTRSGEVLIESRLLDETRHLPDLRARIDGSRVWAVGRPSRRVYPLPLEGTITVAGDGAGPAGHGTTPWRVGVRGRTGAARTARDPFFRSLRATGGRETWEPIARDVRSLHRLPVAVGPAAPLEYSVRATRVGPGLLHEVLTGPGGEVVFYLMHVADLGHLPACRLHLRIGLLLRRARRRGALDPADLRERIESEYRSLFPGKPGPLACVVGTASGFPGTLRLSAGPTRRGLFLAGLERRLMLGDAGLVPLREEGDRDGTRVFRLRDSLLVAVGAIHDVERRVESSGFLETVDAFHHRLPVPTTASLFLRAIPRHDLDRFPSRPELVATIGREMCRRLVRLGCPPATVQEVDIVLEEALANAVKWGNRGNARKRVTLEYGVEDDRLWFTVIDEGTGFRRAGVIDPTSAAGLGRDHGRGILMMRYLMDSVAYNRRGNAIHLEKRFPGAGA